MDDVLTINERRALLGLPPLPGGNVLVWGQPLNDTRMDRWVTTSWEWYHAVHDAREAWGKVERADHGWMYLVPAWLHDVGLAAERACGPLGGRHTDRGMVYGNVARSLDTHERTCRAAYRLAGGEAAMAVAYRVAFGAEPPVATVVEGRGG